MPDRVEHGILNTSTTTALQSARNGNFVFYPAYCYQASPTWFTWVKLTAYDVHNHLSIQHGYHAASSYANTRSTWPQNQPLLLFCLNHPIQFVQLIGVVVSVEDFFDKFWLFILDDSSGATIEVNCRKPEKPDADEGDTQQHGKDRKKDVEAEARYAAMGKLDIGAVVQAKGQITTFRNVRQLQLERITFVNDTNHEVRLIAARTDFYETTLKTPWEISPSKQKRLRDRARGESNAEEQHASRRHRKAQLKAEREKRHAQKILEDYGQEERRRQEAVVQTHRHGTKGTTKN